MSRKKAAAPVDPLDRLVVNAAWIRTRYGVSPRFIDRRIAEGHLKPFKLGNHINRFYADEVVAFFERDRINQEVNAG